MSRAMDPVDGAASRSREAPPPIAVEGVAFRYPYAEEATLREVSFTVRPGELVGIVGPNGGGKTTLLKLLLGLLEPDAGSIRMLGERPFKARRRIGFVPQQAGVDPTVPATVLDIVLMSALARSTWGPRFSARDHAAARAALDQTGMLPLEGRPWATLSGGQRQRVLIARALAYDSELLLLDEPTAGVDLHREQELLDLLHELNRRLPILMVSHDLALVSTHMDKALWVNREVTVLGAGDLTLAEVERLFHGDHSCHPLHGHGHEPGPGPKQDRGGGPGGAGEAAP